MHFEVYLALSVAQASYIPSLRPFLPTFQPTDQLSDSNTRVAKLFHQFFEPNHSSVPLLS